ncbi:MAG: cell division protein ZapB [Spirochaetales bacterium]|nr:cell division protein ZapB [Spirochaetales bacterium]
MVDIEQVRLLEQRVQRVIARIGELQTENRELRDQVGVDREKIAELERRVESFSTNQEEIERGILNALHQLDEVEDAVTESGESRVIPAVDEKPAVTETPEVDEADDAATVDTVADRTPAEESAQPEPAPDTADEDVPPPADETTRAEPEPVTAAPSTDETDGDEEPGPELDIF